MENNSNNFEVQTRSKEGELRTFKTFREALDFAKVTHEKARIAHVGSPDENDRVVCKISFPLPTGERVRLVIDDYSDGYDWFWILGTDG
jgi:hypothetical protein